MGETIVTKTSSTYLLTNGNYSIKAVVGNNSKRITLTSTGSSKYPGGESFTFIGSKPDTLWAIGTLIRDAADLINNPE